MDEAFERRLFYGRRRQAIALCLTAIFATLMSTPPAEAACPRSSDRAPSDPKVRYQPRGSRCEGLYAVPVTGGVGPRLIGFHRRSFPAIAFSTTKLTALSVELDRSARDVALKAVSTRPKTYYAMDTDLPNGALSYAWDTSILASPSIAMRANELSVVACDRKCVPGAGARYYPVTLDVPAAPAGDLGYVAIFQADAAVEQIHVTMQNVAGAIVYDRKVPGRIPASWPIVSTLGFVRPGAYQLRLDARSSAGPRLIENYAIVIP